MTELLNSSISSSLASSSVHSGSTSPSESLQESSTEGQLSLDYNSPTQTLQFNRQISRSTEDPNDVDSINYRNIALSESITFLDGW